VADKRIEFPQHPAVVLLPNPDAVSTGIGVVRSLGRQGIPVVTVGTENRPMSAWSKYVIKHYRVPDFAHNADDYLDALCTVGERLSPRGVLFVSGDEHVLLVNRNLSDLKPLFLYNYLSPEALRKCIDKDAMFAAAQDCSGPGRQRSGAQDSFFECSGHK